MSGAKVEVDVFWDPVNQANMQTEIEKLSNGIVDKKAEDAIENRTKLAATERADISSHYGGKSALKALSLPQSVREWSANKK
jgi:hypothetical protein